MATLFEEAVVTTLDDVDSGTNDTITTRRRAKLVRLTPFLGFRFKKSIFSLEKPSTGEDEGN